MGDSASASRAIATSRAAMDFQFPGKSRNNGARKVSLARFFSRSPDSIDEEMGWHAKYDVEDIVKSAWDAWQANPEHHIDVDTWKQAD